MQSYLILNKLAAILFQYKICSGFAFGHVRVFEESLRLKRFLSSHSSSGAPLMGELLMINSIVYKHTDKQTHFFPNPEVPVQLAMLIAGIE